MRRPRRWYVVKLETSDEQWVIRVLEGEAASFEPLMRRHNQRLFRAARAVLGSDAEAEDVVQEAYIRAYSVLGRYQPGNFGGWMLSIVVNEARTRRRTASRRETLLRERTGAQGAPIVPSPSPTSNPETLASDLQLRRLIESAIDTLPEDQRIVLVLRELEQLSTRETAEAVGVTEVAVRSRLHRGKAALREVLSARVGRELAEAFSFAGSRCDRIVAAVLDRLQRSAEFAH